MANVELSDLRAKLSDQAAEEWQRWIFDRVGIEQETKTALANAIAKDERVNGGANSIRTPLTNFLNGYTHEVHRWVAGESSEKAEALCRLMTDGLTPADLWEHFRSLLPQHELGLSASALDYLEPVVETANWSEVIHPIQRWFSDRRPASELPKPPDAERLRWKQFTSYLDDLISHLADCDERPGLQLVPSVSRDMRRRGVGEGDLFFWAGRERLSRLRHRKRGAVVQAESVDDSFDIVKLEIPFAPLGRGEFVDWVNTLDDLRMLDEQQAGRARDFFAAASVDLLNRLPPRHLLYLLEDAALGPVEHEPRVFQKRRIAWLRRELQENAPSELSDWLGDTHEFFSRWLNIAGSLEGDVTRNDLDNEILALGASTTAAVEREELERALADCMRADADDLPALKRRLLKLMPDRLKLLLEDSQLVLTGATNRLSAELVKLGELELPLLMTPEALANASARASHDLIADAVRLAPIDRVGAWCKVALRANLLDQPVAMQAVLFGLSQRPEREAAELPSELLGLWASFVWASAHGLNSFVGSAPDSWSEYVGRQASESLKTVLPVLDGQDGPIAHLESLVDRDVRRLVEDCCGGHPLGQEELQASLSRLAPFQVPLEFNSRRRERPIALLESAEVELHLASRGDQEARRRILDPTTGPNRDELPPLGCRIEWALDLVDSRNEIGVYLVGQDLWKAFSLVAASESRELRPLVARALAHPVVSQYFSHDVRSALEVLDSGPEEAISKVLESRSWSGFKDHGPSYLEVLLTVAELREAEDFLLALTSLQVAKLSPETQSSLFRADLKFPDGRQPRLHFPNLEIVSELRHRALLVLAKKGIVEPLRMSLDGQWELRSPHIAQQVHRAQALWTAVGPYQSPQAPTLADEVWGAVLERLAGSTLDQLRAQFARVASFSPLNRPDSGYERRIVQIIAMQGAPVDQRWGLLAPFAAELWRAPVEQSLREFWNLVSEFERRDDGDERWVESRELVTERRLWAEENDEATAKAWCETRFDRRRAVGDLDGFGEWVWPHLTDDQRSEVLLDLPEGKLNQKWWSRGQDLPLDDRLRFARRHGSLKERRRIARHLVDSGTGDHEERLTRWFQLPPEERPPLADYHDEIEAFWAALDEEVSLSSRQAATFERLMETTPDPERVVRWLPLWVESWACWELEGKVGKDIDFPQWTNLQCGILLGRIRPMLKELRERGEQSSGRAAVANPYTLGDLRDRFRRLKNRIYKAVPAKVKEGDPQLTVRIDRFVDDLLKTLDREAERPRWSPATTYEDAKARLDSLRASEEIVLGSQIELLFAGLDVDAHTRLLGDVLGREDLFSDLWAAATVLLEVDRSTFSQQKRTRFAGRVLDTVAATSALSGQHRDLIAQLLEIESGLKSTALRRLVRERASELLAKL